MAPAQDDDKKVKQPAKIWGVSRYLEDIPHPNSVLGVDEALRIKLLSHRKL